MTTFTSDALIAHPREQVFGWHARPGALVRLTPHWAGRVEEEARPPLAVGARSRLRIALPGTHGLAGPLWVAEHIALDPGHSFADVMVSGPMSGWHHTHTFLDAEAPGSAGPATRIHDEVEFRVLPGRLPGESLAARPVLGDLERQFAARAERLRADLDFWARYETPALKVLVSGASGLIGTQVAALLSTGGHEVRTLVRREPQRADEVAWDPDADDLDLDAVAWADVIIHLGGASIATRFTAEHKQAILDSRVRSTQLLSNRIADLQPSQRPRAFVCGSAIGWYGPDHGDEDLTEDLAPGDGFLADVCRQWEAATRRAADAGVRVVNLRTGVVQSVLGGSLKLQMPAFVAGGGAVVGDGSNWLSWISLDDIAGVVAHCAIAGVEGPVNAVAPHPVTGEEFADTLASVLGRPRLVRAPGAAPAAVLGEEGARETVLASQRASAQKLLDSGYRFRTPELRDALADEVGA